jgi:uncharacterized protein YkwD
VRLARSAFSAALVSVTVVLALVPALGSARPPLARAAASDAMVQKINEVRARYDLRPLRASPSLGGTSQRFAVQLMQQDVLRHRARPSTSSAYGRAGEVLALHMGRQARVGATVASWMRSPSHRAVLLTRSMNEIGAGVAQGRFRGSQAVIWVAQVGKR